MNREELITEIRRVEEALQKTNSRKLKHDYGRYLKRMYKSLHYYDNYMRAYRNNLASNA